MEASNDAFALLGYIRMHLRTPIEKVKIRGERERESANSQMALKKEKVLMIGKGAQSSILELLSNRLEVARTGASK